MSNSNNNSKWGINRFKRVTSQNSADNTFLNPNDSMHNSRSRTISSSSTSIISTPSNNIRRIQQQRAQEKNRVSQSTKKGGISLIKGKGGLVKSKLLNLQSSKKYISESKEDVEAESGFGIGKSKNLAFDYSSFVHFSNVEVDSSDENYSPPCVKESQIKAWESAEKISRSIIFEDYDDSDEDVENSDANAIESIPGYTKAELAIVQKRFNEEQTMGPNVRHFSDDYEKKLLWELQKHQSVLDEKQFAEFPSFNGKRRIQLAQKKDYLRKIFGYSNNLNMDYITNNSSYSAFTNISSAQKAYHEDKMEISQLMEEHRLYNEAMEETKARLAAHDATTLGKDPTKSRKSDFQDFTYDNYQDILSFKLEKIYEHTIANLETFLKKNTSTDNDFLDPSTVELYDFCLEYLRSCIKEDEDEDNR